MDIKLKNKLIIVAWILLFTFGLSGILTALSDRGEYFNSYFETSYFENDYQQFINYLSMFEINYIPKEQAKEKVEVTAEEIDEHRYRYGDLVTQTADINAQYQAKIDQALQAQNQELADTYIAERDAKIVDITDNFKSDEHVIPKVIKEKEQQIDEYYKELEKIRPDYNRLKTQFKYYLKDTDTNQLYTNLATTEKDLLPKRNAKNILFSRSYPTDKYGYLSVASNYLGYDQLMQPLIGDNDRMFEGTIAVPKSAPAAGIVMSNYRDFEQRQKLFFIHLSCALVALLLSLYLYKKRIISIPENITERWQQYYNRVPIDVCIIGLLIFGLFTLMRLQYGYAFYLYNYLYTYIVNTILDLIVTAFCVSLTAIQVKLLYDRVKGGPNLNALWQTSLTYSIYRWMQEAFLIRSIGTQVLLVLVLVFGFGIGAAAVLVEPEIIFIYAPAFMIIAVPLLILIIKRTGYFNRIVINTNELAQGNMGPDLPLTGKSQLATLAGNINKLKYGVKTSKIEQAKSERLKTELITNVSHDLRTPLTSIITYTELLKKSDITEEDRQSYIEIIDRKSKRLKVLIDDLFEASKMASGSIELTKEKVDLVQLLQQALAEHNEKASQSSLQFRVTTPENPVYAMVDGQKMWRVYDNLISNILKYAMENTRVYISMTVFPDKVIIIFKNITKYELGDDINELFERCKRGDKSRQTEGSGLGLAIAKSIVDLHDGNLGIDLDGDLFKITITLPRN